ncbi:DUF4398 domain-containing protein [Marinobacter fonticola]|uniref:DUF4398 domain-containing protein n=1 Tax=Marinobacter fonticola TaxID=2603215 RepID=UPI0011E70EBB|nr:DUF4398 domain-containing protein [Marinobacter fonticola]
MIRHKNTGRTALVLGLSTLMAACASKGTPPSQDLNAAEEFVRQAEAADARDFEPVLLNRAQNKVADARQLIDGQKYMEAERVLEEAQVDAQLAGARSESAKAENAVEEINRNIEQLRRQINESQQQ